MPKRWTALTSLLVAGLLGTAAAVADESPVGRLTGVVRAEQPLSSAHVYAYDLVSFELRQALTDLAGHFQFTSLPAGLYHVIAYKVGFVPALVPLTRPTGDRNQVLDLRLVRQSPDDPQAAEDYWQVRSRIPPDVLRQIETLEVLAAAVPGSQLEVPDLTRYSTWVEMGLGVDEIAFNNAQMAGGKVDFQGRLDTLDIGVMGNFWRVQPASEDSTGTLRGSSNQVSVDLKSQGNARVNLTTATNRLVTSQDGIETPVDFDHLRVRYVQPLGEHAHSEVAAQVTDERNFYRQSPVDPVEIPQASRTWQVGGTFSKELSERAMVETGFTYRDRQALVAPGSAVLEPEAERVDLFGKAGYRVRPAVLVEYGLVSVLKQGDLAVSPQGGVVFQLNPKWQAVGRFSGRVTDFSPETLRSGDFLPVLLPEAGGCDLGEQRCYQVQLFRRDGDDSLRVGMSHREVGETLRLYFSDDFFDQQESLYLVPGDRVPEMQLAISRRLSPNVLTRLESNLAAGGGGIFYAADRDAFQNEVRYLTTSLDTRFQSTSTGVFLAFYRLEQELVPLADGGEPVVPMLESRLQLKVSQDLDALLDLPADWVLHLNMELSRGPMAAIAPSESDNVRRRILGGIAVKF